jgi:hypothetical protein
MGVVNGKQKREMCSPGMVFALMVMPSPLRKNVLGLGFTPPLGPKSLPGLLMVSLLTSELNLETYLGLRSGTVKGTSRDESAG